MCACARGRAYAYWGRGDEKDDTVVYLNKEVKREQGYGKYERERERERRGIVDWNIKNKQGERVPRKRERGLWIKWQWMREGDRERETLLIETLKRHGERVLRETTEMREGVRLWIN